MMPDGQSKRGVAKVSPVNYTLDVKMTGQSRDFSPLLWNIDPTECNRFHMQFWWHYSVLSHFCRPFWTRTDTNGDEKTVRWLDKADIGSIC